MDPTKVVSKNFHLFAQTTEQGQYPSRIRWKTRWSVRPVQYYLIDFNLSVRYPSRHGNLIFAEGAQDQTVPERSLPSEISYDPFPADVYMMGHGMSTIIEVSHSLAIETLSQPNQEYTHNANLKQLLEILGQMMRRHPQERISAQQAAQRVDSLISSLSHKQMGRRIWKLKDPLSHLDRFLVTYFWHNPPG